MGSLHLLGFQGLFCAEGRQIMMTIDRDEASATNAMYPYEDEIELMDYLKVLWRWKYLILIGTLVCAIGAAVVSLNMTRIYGISTVIQPGMLKVTEDGKTVYIDSPQNIKALIETGGLNGQVLKNIKFPNTENAPTSAEFKVTIPKNTNAVEVLYETPYVDIGLQIMKNLNDGLLGRYGKLLKRYQENYDNEIRSKANEAFKANEKMAKVKHAIGTAEAENESAVSQLSAKMSAKRSEIATLDAQNQAKLSELTAKISSKTAEISTAETENEAKLSELTAKIFSKTAEISTAETETETKVLQIANNISSIGTKISAAEAEKEKAIKEKVNREATIRAKIEAKKKQIHNLEQRISDVKREIGRISKNTDLMLEERNKFLSSAKREDTILASVMYTNTIQQNIGYLNTLRSTVNDTNHQIFQERVGIEGLENDIKDLNAQKENLEKQTIYSVEKLKCDIKDLEAQKESLPKQTTYRLQNLTEEIKDLEAQKQTSIKQTESRIKNLQADLTDLEAQKESLIKQTKYKVETMQSEIKDFENEKNYISGEIKSIEFKKNNIQNIQIIKPPKSSLSPIKPKTRLNVMLAGVVGLFLTVFLSFFIEYISKYKKREQG